MRRRGMPIANRIAYSLADAAVAAYSVWLVTTIPTKRPSRAVYPSAIPALVFNSQCQRDLIENSSAVMTHMSCPPLESSFMSAPPAPPPSLFWHFYHERVVGSHGR